MRGLFTVRPVYDATARFSELLDAALEDGPQAVSRCGVETAVLLPIDPLLDPSGPRDIPLPGRRSVLKLYPLRFDDGESS